MSVTVEVRLNRFGSIARRVGAAMNTRVDDAADQIAARAKEIVPVRTGFLRDSIAAQGSAAAGNREVVASAHYAGYVEFGTIHMAAEPYMQPAVDEVAKDLLGRLGLEAELAG